MNKDVFHNFSPFIKFRLQRYNKYLKYAIDDTKKVPGRTLFFAYKFAKHLIFNVYLQKKSRKRQKIILFSNFFVHFCAKSGQ